MRRSEFSSTDIAEYRRLAQVCPVGYLGLTDPEGFPRVIPLNFLLYEDNIYFHGAGEGEKFSVLQSRPLVTFSIVEPHSLIPSYWLARDYACPATIFYKSAYVRGRGMVVTELEEKAAALQALMEKYQPQGRYRPISATDDLYRKALKEVAVFKIQAEQVQLKFKFGQNLSPAKRRELIRHLEARNEGTDQNTAREIRRTLV